jgi:hypothetical protein
MLNDKIKDLYEKAGFSLEIEGRWPNIYSVGTPMERLVALVVAECAQAAALHANSYSNGEAGAGAAGAAEAVRSYGESLFK